MFLTWQTSASPKIRIAKLGANLRFWTCLLIERAKLGFWALPSARAIAASPRLRLWAFRSIPNAGGEGWRVWRVSPNGGSTYNNERF